MPHKKIEEKYADLLERFFELQTLVKVDATISTLLDELPVCFWMHDEQYAIVYANRTTEERFGSCHGRKCYECFMGESTVCSCCQSKSILAGGQDARCTHCKRRNTTFDIHIYHIPLVSEDGKKNIIKSNMHVQDITDLYRNQ